MLIWLVRKQHVATPIGPRLFQRQPMQAGCRRSFLRRLYSRFAQPHDQRPARARAGNRCRFERVGSSWRMAKLKMPRAASSGHTIFCQLRSAVSARSVPCPDSGSLMSSPALRAWSINGPISSTRTPAPSAPVPYRQYAGSRDRRPNPTLRRPAIRDRCCRARRACWHCHNRGGVPASSGAPQHTGVISCSDLKVGHGNNNMVNTRRHEKTLAGLMAEA